MEVGRGQGSSQVRSLRDHLDVVRRRKWILISALVLLPTVAVLMSMRHQAMYESNAEVLLNTQSVVSTVSGTAGIGGAIAPDREAQTQAKVAATPAVAERVLRVAKLKDRTPSMFLGQSSVAANPNEDILTFTVLDHSPPLAQRLATIFAQQYVAYRRILDTQTLSTALAEVQRQLDRLQKQGQERSALYATLADKQEQLRTLKTLQTANASVVRDGRNPWKVSPRPKRTALLAFVLALVLGTGLVFLVEALDTRVVRIDDVERTLGLPLLAQIPTPPRHLRNSDDLAMITEPHSASAEAYRVLRTNFSFLNVGVGARTVLFTSAIGQEGKSTTISNLGVALARAGQRVVLVDLDLRRPILHRFFDFYGHPGITDIAQGRAKLNFVDVDSPDDPADVPGQGSFSVLTAGKVPTDAGEFVTSEDLHAILAELRRQADIVLIDAPPLLLVGDAMELSSRVDGIVVVTRLGRVRRRMLEDLRRFLSHVPAKKIGYVATAAERDTGYRYGYRYYGGDAYLRMYTPSRSDEAES